MCVVRGYTALALALVFSVPDVVGGQISDSAVTALNIRRDVWSERPLSLQSPTARIFVSYPGESARIFKVVLDRPVGDAIRSSGARGVSRLLLE